jgi:hypothetical protein
LKATDEKSRIRIRNPVLVTDLYKNAMVPPDSETALVQKVQQKKDRPTAQMPIPTVISASRNRKTYVRKYLTVNCKQ